MNQYNDIFLDYKKKGIIEKVPLKEIPQPPGKVHYLAHRPVIRSDGETTKIRAVFDSSCSNSGPSLKHCLYSGPNPFENIFNILLQFWYIPKIHLIQFGFTYSSFGFTKNKRRT